MVPGVRDAFQAVYLRRSQGADRTDAQDWLRTLMEQGRYIEGVYRGCPPRARGLPPRSGGCIRLTARLPSPGDMWSASALVVGAEDLVLRLR